MLLLCAHSPTWLHSKCGSHELTRLLLYLRSIPRWGGVWGMEPEPGNDRAGEVDTEPKPAAPLGRKYRPGD